MVLGYIGIALVMLGAALIGLSIFLYDFSFWLMAPGAIALLTGASFVGGFRETVIRQFLGTARRDQS
jgi:uncharacterized membrane protein